ncbi:MAG: hypothetical protein ACI8W3_000827 [Myxococcota bacterium]|jgi:hypothetical protein
MSRPELVPAPIEQPASAPVSEDTQSVASQEPLDTSQPASREERQETPSKSRALIVFLVIALLVTATVLMNQSRRASTLAGQVATLEGELMKSQAAVSSYETRFEQVRGDVDQLVSQVLALQGRVSEEVVPIIQHNGGFPPIKAGESLPQSGLDE